MNEHPTTPAEGDWLAFVRRFYRDELEPFEKSILETDREKLKRHPVYLAFCKAYFECWRIIKEAADASIDGQLKIDDKVRNQVQELSPLVLPVRSAPAKVAHGTSLGTYFLDAGFDYPAAHIEIEKARRGDRGRPAKWKAAILALEMKLDGKTYGEIADFLETTSPSSGYDDSAHRIDRIRKLIDAITPIYEKYRPRN